MQSLGCSIKYSNTQKRSARRTIGRTGLYTGIPRFCLSVFKLGCQAEIILGQNQDGSRVERVSAGQQ